MTHLPPPLATTLAALVIVAGISDILHRRIPNSLALAGFLAGVVWNCYLFGWLGAKTAALGAGAGFLLFLPPFLLKGRGGGDVKLMGAVGAITGPANALVIFILTAVFGGLLAIGMAASRGALRRVLRNCAYILWSLVRFRAPYRDNPELNLDHPKAISLPYAVAIAAGSLVFLTL